LYWYVEITLFWNSDMFLAWFFLDFNETFVPEQNVALQLLLVCIQKVKVHPQQIAAVSLEMRPIFQIQPFRFSFNFHLWIFTRFSFFLAPILHNFTLKFHPTFLWYTRDSMRFCWWSRFIDFLWYVSSDLRFKCFPL